jgi:tetratricopeptide (TPR) repeat protein
LGKYDEAIKCADKAIEIKRDYAEALAIKGEALGYQGGIQRSDRIC